MNIIDKDLSFLEESLSAALIKLSEGRLNKSQANSIAETKIKQIDYSNYAILHKGINWIAKEIIDVIDFDKIETNSKYKTPEIDTSWGTSTSRGCSVDYSVSYCIDEVLVIPDIGDEEHYYSAEMLMALNRKLKHLCWHERITPDTTFNEVTKIIEKLIFTNML